MNNTEPDFGPEVGDVGPNDSETLRIRIGLLEKQAADYKLLIADFENSRKRLAQDAERQRKFLIEPLVKDLLTALDNLDFTLKAAVQLGDHGQLAKGVSATMQQFLDVLKRHGVHRMDIAAGAAFDPNLHQAVMEQPTNDYEAGTVVNVMQMGFTLHERVLRPASVILAAAPPTGGV